MRKDLRPVQPTVWEEQEPVTVTTLTVDKILEKARSKKRENNAESPTLNNSDSPRVQMKGKCRYPPPS